MSSHCLSRFIGLLALAMVLLAPAPEVRAQGAAVTGRSATSVSITERGKPRGELRKINAGTWIETDMSGAAVAQYAEVKRDDSTVYLADKASDATVQIDLKKRSVLFRDLVTQRRDAYPIQSASDGPVQPMLVVAAAPDPKAKAADTGPAYCWTDSVARGAGVVPGRVADCPDGYTLTGGSCKRAPSTIAAPSRAADCPAGYSNSGASCERPAQTKANPNSRPADCPKGYDNAGTSCFRLSAPEPLDMSKMSCKAGESRIEGRCYKACEAGFTGAGTSCTRAASTLGADHLSCKSGFQKDARTQRCMAVCAAGYSNTGDACVRAGDTLGAEAMLCKAGEIRAGGRCLPAAGACAAGEVQQGELCYKACPAGYEGLGAACFKQPPKAWLACGAGAARDGAACAEAQFDAALTVRHLALLTQAAGISRLPKERAATRKKFTDLTEAYGKARNLPQFKKALAGADPSALDRLAEAASDDEMVRYAAQIAQIADVAGAGSDAGYPKCSTLPVGK